ncbi:MAG: MFS transporter [Sciscionella sp.]|nr:MFS transporter [Sciscionella sp.]
MAIASQRDRRARAVTSAVFFAHATVFASWTPFIPTVKATMHASDAALGVALLGPPIGSVGAMLVVGALISRFGSAVLVRGCLAGYCAMPVLLGLAHSVATVFAALAGWGAFQGGLDVAMNSQAGSVQRRYHRSIFASFHACWSIGAVVGTGLGSLSVALGVALRWHLLGLGALTAIVVLPMTRGLLSDDDSAAGSRRRFARPNRTLLVLGTIAFASLLGEGAAADWSAVYLRDGFAVPAGVAGLGYGAFTLLMFAGRVAGDRIIDSFGRRGAIRAGALLGGGSLGVALLINTYPAGLLGFAGLGLGLSVVVPCVFGAATHLPGSPPGPSLALVTTCGWAGFLCGPPLIGWLASVITLPGALGVVAGVAIAMAVIAGGYRQTPTSPGPRHGTRHGTGSR